MLLRLFQNIYLQNPAPTGICPPTIDHHKTVLFGENMHGTTHSFRSPVTFPKVQPLLVLDLHPFR
jgi:hypothetical protein